MASHSSAPKREQTPHGNRTTRTATILNALKQRAQTVLNDSSLDANSRAILRYALETNDPWLAKLVRQAERSESSVDIFASPQTAETETSETERREEDRSIGRNDL